MRLKIIGWLSIIFIGSTSSAQSPDMYPPTVPEPVENPVLYILLTVAVIAIYFIYRYSQKRKRNKEKDNK